MSTPQNSYGRCIHLRTVIAAIASILVTTTFVLDTQAAEDPKEAFKKFVANPPIISNMVYQIVYDKSADGFSPRQPKLLHFRWQPGAFLLREIQSINELGGNALSLKSDTILAARFGEKACFISRNNYYIWDTYTSTNSYETAQPLTEQYQLVISRPLHLGLPNLTPQSIVWNGDSFSGTNTTKTYPFVLTGNITTLSNGVPRVISFDVSYPPNKTLAHHRLIYTYPEERNRQFPFLPSKIVHEIQMKNVWRQLCELQIHLLETASVPLPESAFDFGDLVRSAPRVAYISVGTNRMFSTPDSPIPAPLVNIADVPLPSAQSGVRTGYWIAVMLSLVVVLFGFAKIRTTRGQRQKQT